MASLPSLPSLPWSPSPASRALQAELHDGGLRRQPCDEPDRPVRLQWTTSGFSHRYPSRRLGQRSLCSSGQAHEPTRRRGSSSARCPQCLTHTTGPFRRWFTILTHSQLLAHLSEGSSPPMRARRTSRSASPSEPTPLLNARGSEPDLTAFWTQVRVGQSHAPLPGIPRPAPKTPGFTRPKRMSAPSSLRWRHPTQVLWGIMRQLPRYQAPMSPRRSVRQHRRSRATRHRRPQSPIPRP